LLKHHSKEKDESEKVLLFSKSKGKDSVSLKADEPLFLVRMNLSRYLSPCISIEPLYQKCAVFKLCSLREGA